MKNILVFDIGVSKTRIGISHDGRRLAHTHVFPTPPHYHAGMKIIIDAGRQLAGSRRISRAIGGFAGPLNRTKTKAVRCQARDWIGRPLAHDLSRAWKTTVQLENDAALNGLGEAVVGAGRGKAVVGFLTVSTGINGVRIVDQSIDRNANGWELHGLLVPGPKGQAKYVGDLVSGRFFAKRFGRQPEFIMDRRIWRGAAEMLAVGLVNLSVAWSPHIFVVGGGMFVPPGIRMNELRQAMKRHWRAPWPMPLVVKGTLGDRSALYGALVLARTARKIP